MNEMIDKAEQAIRRHRQSTTEVQAREAIRAIREPNVEMLTAARNIHAIGSINVWHAMVDAILEGR